MNPPRYDDDTIAALHELADLTDFFGIGVSRKRLAFALAKKNNTGESALKTEATRALVAPRLEALERWLARPPARATQSHTMFAHQRARHADSVRECIAVLRAAGF